MPTSWGIQELGALFAMAVGRLGGLLGFARRAVPCEHSTGYSEQQMALLGFGSDPSRGAGPSQFSLNGSPHRQSHKFEAGEQTTVGSMTARVGFDVVLRFSELDLQKFSRSLISESTSSLFVVFRLPPSGCFYPASLNARHSGPKKPQLQGAPDGRASSRRSVFSFYLPLDMCT